MNDSKSVINRGKRVITLRPHPDGTARVLEPGKSIECLDEREFKLLTGYHDIGDVNKIAPQLAKREADLKAKLAETQAENERLRAQQSAPAAAPAEPAAPTKDKQPLETARVTKRPVKKKGK